LKEHSANEFALGKDITGQICIFEDECNLNSNPGYGF
jgi:hypothetical protein